MRILDFRLIICFFALIFYTFINYIYGYWARRKVPYLKSKSIISQISAQFYPQKSSTVERHSKVYSDLAPHKYGGYFKLFTPVLFIRDPELIKNIITKDFSHFMNRDSDVTNESEALFNLPGERWKILRAKLTPFFRPGKMKTTFVLMKECIDEVVKVIDNEIKENKTIDVKEVMNRMIIDVIGSCIFGLNANSLKNPDSVFHVMGKKVFSMTLRGPLTEFLSVVSPTLRWIMKKNLVTVDIRGFFVSIITTSIEYRKKHNTHRDDLVDLFKTITEDIRNSKENSVLTEKLVIAQGFAFFVAGYETSSGTLTYALYELAKNKKIQDRVHNEIITVLQKYNNELTYDSLQDMSYLEQIVNETLRLYPILPSLDRICNKSYQLDDNYTVQEGTRIKISILGLHTDPQYYKNPNEFNPENFSKEAKADRHHYTYLPFGEGPRMCIGMRFGIMQVKLGLATLIKNYDITLSSKMDGPLKFHSKSFGRILDGNMWLSFEKRIQ